VTAGDVVLATLSITLAVQSAYSVVLALYAWEDERKYLRNRSPTTFEPPRTSFTILLPARHEEQVIQDTVQRMVELNYPPQLVQVLVVIEAGDRGTIAQVDEKLALLERQGVENVRLITFDDPPITKPHGLNVGLREAKGDVVTIFDAEDEPHPDILNVVNTVMLRENQAVIQCGVQLMNYADHWFSSLNVLEYFFWFKSRLHYHATIDMVPLGGNTAFVRREVLERINGWDQNCLTEDADLGIRLGVAGIRVRVIHDDRFVTREETPHSVDQFIKQRTRWNQGFLQVLLKGDWLRLPRLRQRELALYVLAFPMLHALMMLYVPVSLYLTLFVKVPTLVAMITFLPLYVLIAHLIVTLIGLHEFTSAHGLKPSLRSSMRMVLVYLPYQWMLAFAALRAVWRMLRGMNNWEKTTHTGAHRNQQPAGVGPKLMDSQSRDRQ